jgi:two-component system phosphate regulon sensor histidine kinase PhoR
LTIIEAFRLRELDALAARLLKECTVLAVELEVPGATQSYLQVNGSAVLDRQGNQRGAIMVFHDLTRLKQLENTRQEFVANVSHELRTPLSMIKGFVETLLSGAKDDPSVANRFLLNIDKHADRLTFLIEDLLTISRLESGKVLFNLQPTSLADVANRVVEDLRDRAAEKRVRLVNQIPAGLTAWADGDRLQQVFFNLVDNAIKYGRPEGSVILDATMADQNQVKVAVKDDGPGIPPESRERIFERFYRVDKARSREQGGTGLGLSIVKHIVQCHGGRVWVESDLSKGSAFYFLLPKNEAAASNPSRKS